MRTLSIIIWFTILVGIKCDKFMEEQVDLLTINNCLDIQTDVNLSGC